ncbi:helix-turn-helix transcriptional regulator [Amycolatopsis solani]|uniref:helix-turn-helix transcriptional regulator n=1 Tax=Amycolatopsis solani TaxID=3028615 RepID=UPI0025AF8F58|nr:AAA family ATPase [Amycolatopsis sp. MEP2-6]
MREPRLVGRDRAVSVLDDLLAGLAQGRGATATIAGAAGTGRTALLSRVLGGFPGASASCVPDGIPFGAVTQLAAALVPSRAFGELVGECLEDLEGAAGRFCSAFARVAASGPLVLAVDDLPWADEWSLRWFSEMAGRVGEAPVLLIATAYEPVGEGHRIPVAPLTPGETAMLAGQVLGELSPEAEAAVLEVVRGRPAVLHELAAEAAGLHGVGRAVNLGERVTRWNPAGGPAVTSARPHGMGSATAAAAAAQRGSAEAGRAVASARPHGTGSATSAEAAAQRGSAEAGRAVTSAELATGRASTSAGPAMRGNSAIGRAATPGEPGAQWAPAGAATSAGAAVRWDSARVAAAGRAVLSARAARIRRGLPPDALALLRAMSVSERLDVVAAVGLAELPPAAVAGALSALEASGLVADGRPAEPHLAADVLAELAEPERDGLYRRGAELAHRTGAGALVAAELLRAAPPVGEPWARAVLEEAAEQWSAQGNPVAAAESLQRALSEPASPADRAALLVRLASAVVRREPDHADRRLVQVLAEPALAALPAASTAADLLLARGDAETVHRLVAEPGRASTVDPALAALARRAREEAAADPEMPVPALPGPDVFGDPSGNRTTPAGFAEERAALEPPDTSGQPLPGTPATDGRPASSPTGTPDRPLTTTHNRLMPDTGSTTLGQPLPATHDRPALPITPGQQLPTHARPPLPLTGPTAAATHDRLAPSPAGTPDRPLTAPHSRPTPPDTSSTAPGQPLTATHDRPVPPPAGSAPPGQPLTATHDRPAPPPAGSTPPGQPLPTHDRPASTTPGRPLLPFPGTATQDPAAAGVAAFWLAVRGEQRGAVLDLAARALVVREEAPLMPRIAACRALLCAGALGEAIDALTVVVAAARRRDARAAAAQALVYRAGAALRGDRPEDALRDLGDADRELPARCWHPLALPARAAVEITTQLRLGRLEHARHLGAEPLPRGSGHGAAAAFLRHAEAELALAEDDPDTALHAALECGRVLRSRGWVNPMVAAWRTTASLASRRLGDHQAAAALAAEELALAERWGTASALEPLRERVVAGLRRAVPAPRRPADPLPAPRFPVSRPDALSAGERDVAELAARGLANREIARELSIALRTVELRLTKVYRKLGLNGRAALADHWPTRTPGG